MDDLDEHTPEIAGVAFLCLVYFAWKCLQHHHLCHHHDGTATQQPDRDRPKKRAAAAAGDTISRDGAHEGMSPTPKSMRIGSLANRGDIENGLVEVGASRAMDTAVNEVIKESQAVVVVQPPSLRHLNSMDMLQQSESERRSFTCRFDSSKPSGVAQALPPSLAAPSIRRLNSIDLRQSERRFMSDEAQAKLILKEHEKEMREHALELKRLRQSEKTALQRRQTKKLKRHALELKRFQKSDAEASASAQTTTLKTLTKAAAPLIRQLNSIDARQSERRFMSDKDQAQLILKEHEQEMREHALALEHLRKAEAGALKRRQQKKLKKLGGKSTRNAGNKAAVAPSSTVGSDRDADATADAAAANPIISVPNAIIQDTAAAVALDVIREDAEQSKRSDEAKSVARDDDGKSRRMSRRRFRYGSYVVTTTTL